MNKNKSNLVNLREVKKSDADKESQHILNEMRKDVEDIKGIGKNVSGYFMIAWDEKGNANTSWRIPETSPITPDILPAVASSIITKRLAKIEIEE